MCRWELWKSQVRSLGESFGTMAKETWVPVLELADEDT